MSFLRYLFSEVKSGRLQKADALRVLGEFEQGSARHSCGHPLLRAERPTFTSQSFVVTLTGEEFFLARGDEATGAHVPGGLYVELVRAAALESFGRAPGEPLTVEVRDALWSRPVRLHEGGISLSVRLWKMGEQEASYEIVRLRSPATEGNTTEDEALEVCAQGRVLLSEEQAKPGVSVERDRGRAVESWSAEDWGRKAEADGCVLEEFDRWVERIEKGVDESGNGFVLVRVVVPEGAGDEQLAHVAAMDAVLRVAGAFELSAQEPAYKRAGNFEPASLQALKLRALWSKGGYARIRRLREGADASGELDIDFCDENGTVQAEAHGLVLQEWTESSEAASLQPGRMLLERRWEAVPVESGGEDVEPDRHWVVLDALYKEYAEGLRAAGWTVVILQESGADLAQRYLAYA